MLLSLSNETKDYFSGINYSLANEDSRVEQALVSPGAGSHVVAIAGSGSRVVPLLSRNPERLTILDLSREQLLLCELRLAAARKLDPSDYRFLLGYARRPLSPLSAARERRELFNSLPLGAEAREFWSSSLEAWAPQGVIWLGRWERHFRKLGWILRKGFALDARPLFEAPTLESQREAYARCWSARRFRVFLKIFASPWVFNRLYKGRFAGSSDTWAFLDERLTGLLKDDLARTNYFTSLLFLGELPSEESIPIEASDEVLKSCRDSRTELVFRQGDVCELAPRERASFYSLSDALSYVSEDAGKSVLARISDASEERAQAVVRYFMRRPKELETGSFRLDPEASRAAEKQDSTRMYTIQVYRKP